MGRVDLFFFHIYTCSSGGFPSRRTWASQHTQSSRRVDLFFFIYIPLQAVDSPPAAPGLSNKPSLQGGLIFFFIYIPPQAVDSPPTAPGLPVIPSLQGGLICFFHIYTSSSGGFPSR